MGGRFSKNKELESASMEDGNPGYQSALTSYTAACRADPSLQDFDRALHGRADRVIRTLADGAQAPSLTFNTLGEVSAGLLEMQNALANVILQSKEDIRKDKELSRLVEDYFDHGLKLLDFYNSLERCLRRARESQFRIQLALKQFEEEREGSVGGERYVKTLQELQKLKEAGDPFTDEFSKLFHSVHNQQKEMLLKLHVRKKKLEKNLKNAQVGRRVTNAIFVTAFVCTLIFSVMAVAIAAPPVVIALAAALAAPIGTVGKWCDTLWKNYRRKLKEQNELIGLMKEETKFSIRDLDTIQLLMSKLEIKIKPILENADFALGEGEEEAVKLVMLDIKKNAEVFMETIEKLCTQAAECSSKIRMARALILQRILGQSGG